MRIVALTVGGTKCEMGLRLQGMLIQMLRQEVAKGNAWVGYAPWRAI